MTVGGLGQTQHIAPQQNQGLQQGGEVQGKTIGQHIASFFKAIGNALAAPFKWVAAQCSKQPAHDAGVQGGDHAVATKPTTGKQSKSEMKAEFRNSDLYKLASQEGSTLKKSEFDKGLEKLLDRPATLKLMREHGISITEAVAIFVYTTEEYKPINAELRSGKELSPQVDELVKQCNAGLEKLPSNDEPVYRGVRFDSELGDKYVKGYVSQDLAYNSTSNDPDSARDFAGSHMFNIQPKEDSKGKGVVAFSNVQSEAEILYPPGTKFEVLSVEKPMFMGTTQVYMKEI